MRVMFLRFIILTLTDLFFVLPMICHLRHVTHFFYATNFPRKMLFCGLLLLFGGLAGTGKDFDVELEPGHVKQEYDSVEEVRSHDNETQKEKQVEDDHLMKEAILDVAYYLRRFKFSGHDPRYLAKGEIPKQNLFVEFPSPPLRNIHWEVKKNCEPSFAECLKYLQEQVSQAVLPRYLDSLTITKQNGWSFITDRDLIKAADDECLELLENDEHAFVVFSGSLQRFQWLTSASYYMCLYTMKEISYLKTFAEDCDNYGSCIQWEFGINNKDVRGDNSQPFACAFYSFCPDPCCSLKYLPDRPACREISPCTDEFSADRTCSFSRKENINLESLISNQWNISCHCNQSGMRWDSKSGMCVDVDECVESEFPCNFPSETCRNLPGTYECACSAMGYHSNPSTLACERDPILERVLYPPKTPSQNETKSFSKRFTNKLQNIISKIKTFVSVALAANEADLNRTEVF